MGSMHKPLRQRNRVITLGAMSRRRGKRKQTSWFTQLLAIADRAGDTTQQDIARTLGVSKSAVTGWAQGTPPSPETILKIAA
jgi:transcriptional regulator with XRE-family HTH domain